MMKQQRTWHSIFILCCTISFCSCALKLPQTKIKFKKIENTPMLTINVKGEVRQGLFGVSNDKIKKVVENEMQKIFSKKDEKIEVIVDVNIEYKWQWIQKMSFWPPKGPEGTHSASVDMVCTVLKTDKITKLKSRSKLEAKQSMFSGWKYDLPIKGGIVRYILRDAIDDIYTQLQQVSDKDDSMKKILN